MSKTLEKEIEDDEKAIANLMKKLEKKNSELVIQTKYEKNDTRKDRKKKAQLKYDKGELVEKILGENIDESFLIGLLKFGKDLNEKNKEALKNAGEKIIEKKRKEEELKSLKNIKGTDK